jgi:hypothetical protein
VSSRPGGRRIRGAAVAAMTVATTILGVGAVAQAAPASGELVAGTPCTATARACADLSALQAWLLEDGGVVRGPVAINVGADGDDATPTGVFHVEWKHEDHVSAEWEAPMPYAVFFAEGGIAFHEGSVKSQSHGCIHLAHDDAAAFYDFLQVGDEVQVRPAS